VHKSVDLAQLAHRMTRRAAQIACGIASTLHESSWCGTFATR